MSNLRTLCAVVLGVSLSLGCASEAEGPVEGSVEEVGSFEFTSLSSITENDLCDAYASALAKQIAESKAANPDVAQVSLAGVDAFVDHRDLLGGSLRWYFATQNAPTIEVSSILTKMMGVVRPAVRNAVGVDGFVDVDELTGNVPKQLVWWSVGEARFNAATAAAKNPSGVDLKDALDGARVEFDEEGLYLPVRVSKKPTTSQLAKIWPELADAGEPIAIGQDAKTQIGEIFDAVVLGSVLTAPSVTDAWLFSYDTRGSIRFVAVFMDEHKQVWGCSISFQNDYD